MSHIRSFRCLNCYRYLLSSKISSFSTDTESLKVTQKILDEFSPGKIYTWKVKAMMLGRQREDVAKSIIEIYNLPITWQHYVKLAQEYSKVFMENCALMPGWLF